MRGCRVISGVLVVTRVRSTTTKCTRDRGCNGHPAFPTPSLGAEDFCRARAHCVARSRTCIWNWSNVIASEAKQSILSLCGEMDCFASLAMTLPAVLKIEVMRSSTLLHKTHLSCPDLIRASIFVRKPFQKRWITGSSPVMTISFKRPVGS